MNKKTARTIFSTGIFLSAIIGIFMISSGAYAQSFSCSRAQTPSEMAICNNENLILKDERLASIFADRLVEAIGSNNVEILSNQHGKWLEKRNSCHTDFKCLEERYSERIEVLIDS